MYFSSIYFGGYRNRFCHHQFKTVVVGVDLCSYSVLEVMSKNSAENLLKKLRRLDSNMSCPNCDTHAQPGIGFGNVCVKFKTFVCDHCMLISPFFELSL